MPYKLISQEDEDAYNQCATHPLQSFAWGEFRKKTGIKVIRARLEKRGKLTESFQLTIHKIPHTPWSIGYLPKGSVPTSELIEEITRIGKQERCIFIQLEPNVLQKANDKSQMANLGLHPAAHPLFTTYSMILDLTKSEEELLKHMHNKTRYNIRVAEKHGVKVREDNSDLAFERYLALTRETTGRQGFFAHTERYHRLMWETLRPGNTGNKTENDHNMLTAHLLTASYKEKILVTWIVFVFHDTLYYPYGASSNEQREVMASTAMMWETIRWGKKMGLTQFDMWGSLGPDADPKDPWYGFHRFKQGFGPELVEFIGSYDLVIHPFLYQLYKISDKVRWLLLKMKK
ncbi:MAG: hypothetical protein RLZZ455_1198 [Candidatus Parcubacteria bacterium]|jgi:lipid II:glycine glycyltransferase (peptidoglycan interpeptide bridge formation enzyme)